jgi:hypothetical protein
MIMTTTTKKIHDNQIHKETERDGNRRESK